MVCLLGSEVFELAVVKTFAEMNHMLTALQTDCSNRHALLIRSAPPFHEETGLGRWLSTRVHDARCMST